MYDKIVITLKNGERIKYRRGEWDDYAYDGSFFIIKKKKSWIALYNCQDVFSFELK